MNLSQTWRYFLIKRKILVLISLLLILFSTSVPKIFSINTFNKNAQNPILNISSSGWDNTYVWQPSVLLDGTTLKMWFSGYGSGRFQIGLVTSSDGVNWSKYSQNPVVSRLSIDNKDAHDPTVIKKGVSYEMWYVGSDGGGATNYSVFRATSSDGVSWNNSSSPVFRPSSGWGSGGVSSPLVLKIGSEYKMWFSSADTGHWAIGLATSSDGINWTPYASNPVLAPTKSWEGSDLDGSSVTYDGTTYEIFYHGSGNLSYATSTDGITWIKPADKNPVLTRGASFDNNYIAGPSAVRLNNGTTLLYYGANGNVNDSTTWRVGLASDGPIDISPPPPPTTKVIIIPGLGASWNADALLNCKPDSYTGDWTLNPVATAIYEPIQTALTAVGVTPLLFPYDWRRSVTSNHETLASFITTNTTELERVHVVGHSMGGLVGRAYYETHKGNEKLDHFLTVGSPHKGTPYAYPAWSGGEIWNSDILFRIYLTLLTKRCNRSHGTSNRESIQQFIPSIQELLPTTDYLRNWKTKTIIPVATMQAKNSWLPNALFNPPFATTMVGSLLGTGWKTLRGMNVRPQSSRELSRGDWIDGNPEKRDLTGDGDGTVLANSAAVDGVDTIVIPQSHVGLIQSSEGIGKILSFLGLASASSQFSITQTIEPSSALIFIADQATLQLDVPGAASIQDVEGMITLVNPKKGNYTLRVNPLTTQSMVTVAQFLQDGRILWREYPQTKKSSRVKTLQFDPQKTQEDILR